MDVEEEDELLLPPDRKVPGTFVLEDVEVDLPAGGERTVL